MPGDHLAFPKSVGNFVPRWAVVAMPLLAFTAQKHDPNPNLGIDDLDDSHAQFFDALQYLHDGRNERVRSFNGREETFDYKEIGDFEYDYHMKTAINYSKYGETKFALESILKAQIRCLKLLNTKKYNRKIAYGASLSFLILSSILLKSGISQFQAKRLLKKQIYLAQELSEDIKEVHGTESKDFQDAHRIVSILLSLQKNFGGELYGFKLKFFKSNIDLQISLMENLRDRLELTDSSLDLS